jgi:aquaporin NIP
MQTLDPLRDSPSIRKTELAGANRLTVKKLAAEFCGTFALVFAGTGAIVINEVSGGAVTHAGIALTFGLIVLAMIYTVGDVSGAHLNPAVTIGFFASGRFEAKSVLPYIVSQMLGAIGASLLLRLLFMQNLSLGRTAPAGSAMQSFLLELLLTFLLMWVILSVSVGAKEKGITAGIAIGSVIGLEAMFAGPICGASMNPARSFAPAFVSMHFQSLWIYLIAPVCGALLAVPICRLIRDDQCCRVRFLEREFRGQIENEEM